ncbi:RluA family pseudouridine synthase, partial [Pseudoflavonifractor phocaeensis]|uniref:RluA family pseudouridine synthase n=1 Tax=Pseudoflavonifractor phocaeensis TaxID=1870988 RepID=UPI00195BCA61
PLDVLPQDIPLDVVYEDGDVIVVNKPVGMVVHPAPGHPDGTLVNALLYHCKNSLSGINGTLRPGIVHRIDRDTSGLIIAAKNDFAHLALADQLQDHSLYREYEAVCVGTLKEDGGTVNAPIFRHPTDRKKMAVNKLQGRPAVTHWTVLERLKGHTHIQCRLETGRTHQIRVHMAYMGHPLLGDTVYGAKKPWPGLAGQCLHARRLSFTHPRTGERVTLECPLPDWFTQTLDKLRPEG